MFDDTVVKQVNNAGPGPNTMSFYRPCIVPSLLQLINDLERKDKDEVELGKLTEEFVLVKPYTSVVRVLVAKSSSSTSSGSSTASDGLDDESMLTEFIPHPKFFTYYPGKIISLHFTDFFFDLLLHVKNT